MATLNCFQLVTNIQLDVNRDNFYFFGRTISLKEHWVTGMRYTYFIY